MRQEPPVPEPVEQHEGHLVVLSPAGFRRWMERPQLAWCEDAEAYRHWLGSLHGELGVRDASHYRGQDREPIDRWDDRMFGPKGQREIAAFRDAMTRELREELERLLRRDATVATEVRARWLAMLEESREGLASQGFTFPDEPSSYRWRLEMLDAPREPLSLSAEQIAATPDLAARRLLFQRLGPDPNMTWQVEHVSERVIEGLPLAREILAACDRPDEREIIHVARAGREARGVTLGYDVGYWGGDHMSALCDTIVVPRYHPAPDEALRDLRAFVARLNEHLLFPEREQAEAFRAWYVGQPWAEIGEFEVLAVAAAE